MLLLSLIFSMCLIAGLLCWHLILYIAFAMQRHGYNKFLIFTLMSLNWGIIIWLCMYLGRTISKLLI